MVVGNWGLGIGNKQKELFVNNYLFFYITDFLPIL
jgi:hypothetical protein